MKICKKWIYQECRMYYWIAKWNWALNRCKNYRDFHFDLEAIIKVKKCLDAHLNYKIDSLGNLMKIIIISAAITCYLIMIKDDITVSVCTWASIPTNWIEWQTEKCVCVSMCIRLCVFVCACTLSGKNGLKKLVYAI